MKISIEELRRDYSDWIIMEAVVGSQSFGLATEKSDIDCRGVFVLPLNLRLEFDAIDQIADERNNEVYWELGKFIQLFNNGNPSSLEFLFSPEHCIRRGKDWFEFFRTRPVNYLNMRCKETFVKYARGQLHRAYGLNKKVFAPQSEVAPQVLDFCHIVTPYGGSKSLKEWMKTQKVKDQKWYAAAAIDHIDNGFAIYCQDDFSSGGNRWAYGIVRDETSACDVQTCSIPKDMEMRAVMVFNKNAFCHACKKHTEYWQWVKLRNEERYEKTIAQGKGYDAKNVMHCIRLLMTAKDIATKHVLTVDRSADRDYLLGIKSGKLTYDEVVALGNRLCDEVDSLFDVSGLPATAFSASYTPNHLLCDCLKRCPGDFYSLGPDV